LPESAALVQIPFHFCGSSELTVGCVTGFFRRHTLPDESLGKQVQMDAQFLIGIPIRAFAREPVPEFRERHMQATH
jgi:hypothetical protein